MAARKTTRTTVGDIHPDVLAYTAGRDVELDHALVAADCVGTAAHVVMLSRIKADPPILTRAGARRVVKELTAILREHGAGRFRIRLADQMCTWPWSGGLPGGWGTWDARCTPAEAAMTRSPSTCGCTPRRPCSISMNR